MGPKRTYLMVCAVAAVCAALAPPADARHRHKHRHKPTYASGAYVGTISQRFPSPTSMPIRFAVSGHTLSGLNVTVTELCGFVVTFVTDAPKALRVPIAANGSFSYDKTVVGDHLGIKGRLRGNRAVGTFFDSLSSGTLGCSMAGVSPFTAKH